MARLLRTLLIGLLLGSLVGVVCGLASGIFLILLEAATKARGEHVALVFALPLAGFVLGSIQHRWGRSVKAGQSLIIDTIHDGGPRLPLRMAPMVLLGTVLTHLFGGSAGREGTAVQMGASLADAIASKLRVSKSVRRQLLAAGMAGGFGAVFGTPAAGAVFGLEVVCIGRLGLELDALWPALVAAVVGDMTTRSLGVTHTPFPVVEHLGLTPLVLCKLFALAVAVALVTVVFIELTHWLKARGERLVPSLPLRMALGGALLVALWQVAGTNDYLGLGVPTIVRAFSDPALTPWAFVAKLIFTAVTLAAGFLGGEVTPLFFVGATLGNVAARVLGLPLDLGAGLGMAAVFGAAANTPLALTIMAVELLGAEVLPHVLIVTTAAFLLTGHRGIYPAQRIARRKSGGRPLRKPIALRALR